MCGIVGYVGSRNALGTTVAGLRRLEYRGYDSAGVAVVADGALQVRKRAGRLDRLADLLGSDPLPGSRVAIGHTRWATHGAPTDQNAHPHVDPAGRVALIHNGIIENHAALRAQIIADGGTMTSETDSEVVAHLLAGSLAAGMDLPAAMRQTVRRLVGSFTLVAVSADEPDLVVGARRNSPLVVGCGEGENFLASDVAAFIDHTRQAIELGQDQIVEVRADGVTVTDFDGQPVTVRHFTVDWDAAAAEKGGYDLFMLKEIAEQPRAVADTLAGRLTGGGILDRDQLDWSGVEPAAIESVTFIACGTAHHAAMIGRYAIEQWARIPCTVELASEFRYREPLVGHTSLVVAISQSGETMDTIMALRHAQERGARVLAVCNTQGASIPRESDATLYTRAGPEIAVASTKAFLTQVVAVELLALHLGVVRQALPPEQAAAIVARLTDLPGKVDLALDTVEPVRALARRLANARSVLFIGRHVGYPVALEGALKLKELAYMHAEGFAAGELKHGPIALIEDGTPVVVVMPPPGTVLHEKVMSNVAEVRARGARTVVVAQEGDETAAREADDLIIVPSMGDPAVGGLLMPVVTTVPLQVLACELATVKGHDVDRPRNLAKSVTVE
ncbi:MAG: glutamine--fructose-6-phosphate transaminase (isomerizing) [Actinomycetales bacterium]|nr:glutamine--fructose-6-phosphate transaminase (isomerizing) [Actinomycetales bacterium]